PLGPSRGSGQDWTAGRREHRDTLLAFDRDARAHLLEAPDTRSPDLWTDASTRLDATWPDVIAVRERVLRDGAVRESPSIVHDGERHPRTALGLSADRRTLWFVVIDGRTEASSGATTRELATALSRLGARDGMKLDGGGSSTLYVRGRGVLNHPSDGHERVVANHVGVVLDDHATGTRAWCRSAARANPPRSGGDRAAYVALFGAWLAGTVLARRGARRAPGAVR
ncbi:MAG: phosphodiester glycosidase family protein, partial [Deltaproteobacteria bacterium]